MSSCGRVFLFIWGIFLEIKLQGCILTNTWYCLSFLIVSVSEYPVVVLICVSLMTNDCEHHFMCLSSICISSLVKCLLKSSVYSYGIFVCLKSYQLFIILDTIYLSIRHIICKYFLSICLTLSLLSVGAWKIWILMKSSWSVFFYYGS